MARKTRDKSAPFSFEAAGHDVAPPRDEAFETLFAADDSVPDPVVAPTSVLTAHADDASDDASDEFPNVVELHPVEPEPDLQLLDIPEPVLASEPAKPAAVIVKAAPELPGWARSAYWIAVPAAVLWAGVMAAFASGYQNPFGPFEYRPFPMVAFGALCLLPAVFILLTAYAVRQAAKLSVETRHARALAADIAIPAALAADQAGGAAETVRREVERATAAAAAAEQQLLSLRRALAEESERLVEATSDAERRAHDLTAGLAREREEMGVLTGTLDAQVQAVTGAITAQSRLVADASDLAAAQIQEAEAALAARATDLAVAAGEAGEAARIAADVLAEQVEKLEVAGEGLSVRAEGMQAGLSSEHTRLLALADSLRADQAHIAAQIEAQRNALLAASAEARAGADDLTAAASDSADALRAGIEAQRVELAAAAADARATADDLADASALGAESLRAQMEAQRVELAAAAADARATADDLADASAQSAESLRALIASVAEQVGQLAADAEADQAAMRVEAQSNLKLFTGVVAEERAALEAETRAAIEALAAAAADTRKAAIEQTEAARDRVQQLGEASFALVQQTDQAFEARISSAKRMIEQSAGLVEDAGQRSAERIEAGLAATHGALAELHSLLGDIDAKVAALPEDARARAESVRQAVEQGIGELTAAARKAAEDTQAIDAAFQGRIKHNYEMLSEALRLMSRVAGAADVTAKAAPAPQPKPAEPPKPVAARPAPEPAVNAVLPETPRSIRVPPETFRPEPFRPEPSPQAASAHGESAVADAIGLRPRLRLTAEPTEPVRRPAPAPLTAEAPRPAAPAVRATSDEWTWKDLLSSIDEPPMDDEVLAERLISEIEALGLDAPALLPLSRIDELAVVMQAGDVAGAREVVRSLAPSAVRRLSRRVLTDKVLHAHADRYLQRYEDLLADSAKRDRDGFVTATLLGSDPGRAFLLFNAAVGELH